MRKAARKAEQAALKAASETERMLVRQGKLTTEDVKQRQTRARTSPRGKQGTRQTAGRKPQGAPENKALGGEGDAD